ncbi:GT2 family glycosyltransferase [Flavobacteriaceae bacterium MAR_2010_72]|nr:GT2 family glycosyltransferase [Flavobacteriaceae bacterium MAR_2010_72]
MKLVVILVTYNGARWLRHCMQSAFESSIPVEVVVIDNNSTDNTLDILKEYPEIMVFKQSSNLGFGLANNLGISYAFNRGADYVFLLNQDAYLQHNTLERLVEVHQSQPEFGVLSPIHLTGDGTGLDLNFSNYLQKNESLVFDSLTSNFSKSIYEVPFVNAAGWLISRQVLNTVGGFDPIFFHYGEDVNFCQRLAYHGLKIGIVPNTYLLHDRLDRNQKKKWTPKERLDISERKLKVVGADINLKDDEFLKKQKRSLYKSLIKQGLQLKFRAMYHNLQELKLINRIEGEIIKSRELNIKSGPNYLNIQ